MLSFFFVLLFYFVPVAYWFSTLHILIQYRLDTGYARVHISLAACRSFAIIEFRTMIPVKHRNFI